MFQTHRIRRWTVTAILYVLSCYVWEETLTNPDTNIQRYGKHHRFNYSIHLRAVKVGRGHALATQKWSEYNNNLIRGPKHAQTNESCMDGGHIHMNHEFAWKSIRKRLESEIGERNFRISLSEITLSTSNKRIERWFTGFVWSAILMCEWHRFLLWSFISDLHRLVADKYFQLEIILSQWGTQDQGVRSAGVLISKRRLVTNL